MLLNDPKYANQIAEAIDSVNKLLNRVKKFRFIVNIGAELHPAYSSGRGVATLALWPDPSRYYLLGVSFDPRGNSTSTRETIRTTTTTNGTSVIEDKVITNDKVEQTAPVFTFMLGKLLWDRIDLSIGALHGDGAGSLGIYLGPKAKETLVVSKLDVFFHGMGSSVDARLGLQFQPFVGDKHSFSPFYVRGAMESIRQVNGKFAWSVGAGVTFDDEDIRLLFALR